MTSPRHLAVIVALFAAMLPFRGASQETVSAKGFADGRGMLDDKRALLYVIYRDKVSFSKISKPGDTSIDLNVARDSLEPSMDDLRSKTHHDSPWTWQELDAAFPQNTESTSGILGLPAVGGVTKKGETTNGPLSSFGPFTIRSSSSDIGKSVQDAKGATFSYSRDALKKGNDALNSQGIVYYPLIFNEVALPANSSLDPEADFGVEWNVVHSQNTSSNDIESLNFNLPLTAYLYPGFWPFGGEYDPDQGASSSLVVLQAKPYYETDFNLQHEIYGAQASLEYVGTVFGAKQLYLGAYQSIILDNLQYQARLIPNLDYSVTEKGGTYTKRKRGDDWLRIGGTASFDLRYGLKTFNALEAGVSYQFLGTVNGNGGFSYLFGTHLTLWVIENAGFTLQYSKGEAPVAAKPIDLLTAGLEFKF